MGNMLENVNEETTQDVTAFGALSAAATAGATVAKFLGKRSIYGIIAGVGITLIAREIMRRRNAK